MCCSACRLPVSYAFDHPAGYHEEGSAFVHVQRVWGNIIAPQWISCLGYIFGANGYIEVDHPLYAYLQRVYIMGSNPKNCITVLGVRCYTQPPLRWHNQHT